MDIIIRNATIQDIEAIADIKIAGWQTAYRGIIDDEFLDNMNRNQEIEKRKNNLGKESLIVAEYNGRIVGFSLYRAYNKDVASYPNADCEISSIYIEPTLKRNGIGKKMMKYIIEDLKEKGKKQMILGCLEDNYSSRAFYDKMGGKIFKNTTIGFGNKQYGLVMYKFDILKMQ